MYTKLSVLLLTSLLQTCFRFAPLKQPPARYWDELQDGKDENKVGKDGEQTGETPSQKHVEKAKKRKNDEDRGDAKKFISGVSEYK